MLAGQNNILNMIELARGIVKMIHELNQQVSIFSTESSWMYQLILATDNI
jgi:hypothetical protein